MKWNFKMTKTLAIALVVTIVIALVLRYVMQKKGFYDTPSTTQTETEVQTIEQGNDTESDSTKEESEELSGNGFSKEHAIKQVNSYDCVQIEKICTVITDDGNGNQNMEYTQYLISDVNLGECTDHTADYSDAIGEDAFDDQEVKQIAFSDAFGFSYESCSDLSEFYKSARKSIGFDADIEDATYDEEKYSLNKEESYEFNGNCSILHILLGNENYDQLQQSTCYYTLTAGEDGTKYPTMFTAVVQYQKGDEIVTKTTYLGFNFYKIDQNGEECCGVNTGDKDIINVNESNRESSAAENDSGCDSNEPCASCGGVDECLEECAGVCCK